MRVYVLEWVTNYYNQCEERFLLFGINDWGIPLKKYKVKLNLVTELHGKDAKSFIEKMKNPPPNPARDETIRRAQEILKAFDGRIVATDNRERDEYVKHLVDYHEDKRRKKERQNKSKK